MILPCRIHRSRSCVEFVPFALLFIAFLLTVVNEATAQEAVGSTAEEAGVSWFPAVPLHITAGMDLGYDDRVIGSNGSNASTSSSGQGSFLTRENVVLSYNRGRERTQISLLGVGRFTQYFDVGTDDKDGTITLSLTYNYSTRLSFYTSVYAAYQTEPDFQSNVGPENVRSDHFDTRDIFSVTYHWLPRFATITSYTFHGVKYAESSIGSFQDRVENTLDETFQFSLTRRTNLIGDYAFQIVDYDTAPNNSVTHSVRAGITHNLTEHITLHALAGESFRSQENGGDSMSPNVQTSVAYARSNHSLIWTTSYGFEEPNVQNASSSITIRTGLTLQYHLTSRIGARANVFYHHSQNQNVTSSGTSGAGSQDSYDITLGLHYTINKHFDMHVTYQNTSQSSTGSNSGYSRNRYFAGLTYTYGESIR